MAAEIAVVKNGFAINTQFVTSEFLLSDSGGMQPASRRRMISPIAFTSSAGDQLQFTPKVTYVEFEDGTFRGSPQIASEFTAKRKPAFELTRELLNDFGRPEALATIRIKVAPRLQDGFYVRNAKERIRLWNPGM